MARERADARRCGLCAPLTFWLVDRIEEAVLVQLVGQHNEVPARPIRVFLPSGDRVVQEITRLLDEGIDGGDTLVALGEVRPPVCRRANDYEDLAIRIRGAEASRRESEHGGLLGPLAELSGGEIVVLHLLRKTHTHLSLHKRACRTSHGTRTLAAGRHGRGPPMACGRNASNVVGGWEVAPGGQRVPSVESGASTDSAKKRRAMRVPLSHPRRLRLSPLANSPETSGCM